MIIDVKNIKKLSSDIVTSLIWKIKEKKLAKS